MIQVRHLGPEERGVQPHDLHAVSAVLLLFVLSVTEAVQYLFAF